MENHTVRSLGRVKIPVNEDMLSPGQTLCLEQGKTPEISTTLNDTQYYHRPIPEMPSILGSYTEYEGRLWHTGPFHITHGLLCADPHQLSLDASYRVINRSHSTVH